MRNQKESESPLQKLFQRADIELRYPKYSPYSGRFNISFLNEKGTEILNKRIKPFKTKDIHQSRKRLSGKFK